MPPIFAGNYYSDGSGRDTFIIKEQTRLNGSYQLNSYDKNRPRAKEYAPESIKAGPIPGFSGHKPLAQFYFGKSHGAEILQSLNDRGRRPLAPAEVPKPSNTGRIRSPFHKGTEDPKPDPCSTATIKLDHLPTPGLNSMSQENRTTWMQEKYMSPHSILCSMRNGTEPEINNVQFGAHISGYAGHLPRTQTTGQLLSVLQRSHEQENANPGNFQHAPKEQQQQERGCADSQPNSHPHPDQQNNHAEQTHANAHAQHHHTLDHVAQHQMLDFGGNQPQATSSHEDVPFNLGFER